MSLVCVGSIITDSSNSQQNITLLCYIRRVAIAPIKLEVTNVLMIGNWAAIFSVDERSNGCGAPIVKRGSIFQTSQSNPDVGMLKILGGEIQKSF